MSLQTDSDYWLETGFARLSALLDLETQVLAGSAGLFRVALGRLLAMLRSDPSHHRDSATSVTDGMTVLFFYVASISIAVRAWRNIGTRTNLYSVRPSTAAFENLQLPLTAKRGNFAEHRDFSAPALCSAGPALQHKWLLRSLSPIGLYIRGRNCGLAIMAEQIVNALRCPEAFCVREHDPKTSASVYCTPFYFQSTARRLRPCFNLRFGR